MKTHKNIKRVFTPTKKGATVVPGKPVSSSPKPADTTAQPPSPAQPVASSQAPPTQTSTTTPTPPVQTESAAATPPKTTAQPRPRTNLTLVLIGVITIVIILLGITGYALFGREDSTNTNPTTSNQGQPPSRTNDGEAPIVTIDASPATVNTSGVVTLTWDSTNADSCMASGAWAGDKPLASTEQSEPLTIDSTFILTCSNNSGSANARVTVIINETTDTTTALDDSTSNPNQSVVAPVLSLGLLSNAIDEGQTVALSWFTNTNVNPAPVCTASGAWSGTRGANGSEPVSPPAGSHSYTLTCTNSAGSDSRTATLTVNSIATCGNGGGCTSAEVASHNTADDCWMIVYGEVYSLTANFLTSIHTGTLGPGSDPASFCGQDISSVFNKDHNGGARVGGGQTAADWLTSDGNSYIDTWIDN